MPAQPVASPLASLKVAQATTGHLLQIMQSNPALAHHDVLKVLPGKNAAAQLFDVIVWQHIFVELMHPQL